MSGIGGGRCAWDGGGWRTVLKAGGCGGPGDAGGFFLTAPCPAGVAEHTEPHSLCKNGRWETELGIQNDGGVPAGRRCGNTPPHFLARLQGRRRVDRVVTGVTNDVDTGAQLVAPVASYRVRTAAVEALIGRHVRDGDPGEIDVARENRPAANPPCKHRGPPQGVILRDLHFAP